MKQLLLAIILLLTTAAFGQGSGQFSGGGGGGNGTDTNAIHKVPGSEQVIQPSADNSAVTLKCFNGTNTANVFLAKDKNASVIFSVDCSGNTVVGGSLTVNGSNGGEDFTCGDGSGLTGATSHGLFWCNPTTNLFNAKLNNGSTVTVLTTAAGATLTDGATVTWATASSPTASATLTFTVHAGSRTLNVSGLVAQQTYVLKLIQDSTGGTDLAGGTGCTWKQPGGGGSTFGLTHTASAIDTLTFFYDGTNCLASLLKAYS